MGSKTASKTEAEVRKLKRNEQKQVPVVVNNKDFFVHIYLLFEDGYYMEFLSTIFCEKTGRSYRDKMNDIAMKRKIVSKKVSFYPQDTDYNSVESLHSFIELEA